MMHFKFYFFLVYMSIIPLLSNTQSLRFTASSINDLDRVKIAIEPNKVIDVKDDFTIEFCIKAKAGDNNAGHCDPSSWYYGNVIVDRDIFGGGDYGDYGIVICNRKLIFGIEKGNSGSIGLRSNTNVDDDTWKHVAITRVSSSGALKLFINGVAEDSIVNNVVAGDISYRNNRATSYPNSDPYLVLGAEKHDYPGSLYFNGLMDELRISDTVRYQFNFSPPMSPFVKDLRTVGLYHFDESTDSIVYDDTLYPLASRSNGIIRRSNPNNAPFYDTDSPFLCNATVLSTNDSGNQSLRHLISCSASNSKIFLSKTLVNQPLILSTSSFNITKNLEIINLSTSPIELNVFHNDPLFNVQSGYNLRLSNIKITRMSGSQDPLIVNQGTLNLENVILNR